MDAALANAAENLGFEKLHDYQVTVIKSFIDGHNVFFSAPTGSGKTCVIEMAPQMFDLCKSLSEPAIVCVVSPLISLMRSQCAAMKRKGLNAVCLCDVESGNVDTLKAGKFQIIIGSPEDWLGRWRDLLCSDVYRQRVQALFVDEAHCINTWGLYKEKEKAFRKMYGQIGELRSLVPVPCITLTATASKDTECIIKDLLDMSDCVDVIIPPNKSNIKYSIFDQGEKENLAKSFGWLVDELECKGRLTDKVLIYTRSYKDCHMIYEFLVDALGEKAYSPYMESGENNDKHRLFDMFHSNVEDEQNISTVESFNSPEGNIRVLVSTSALGMGVDIHNVYECYHFGPPYDFGRCGDKVSHAVMITYNSGQSVNSNEDVC